MEIQTKQLILRRWRDTDTTPFIDLCSDADVMKYFVKPQSPDETLASVARIRQHFESHGYGVWAVEVPGVADFIGFIGLQVQEFEAHFTPCVEIGWRLAKQYWRQGFASEGAFAALRYGFDQLGLKEIVSMTVPDNIPSRGCLLYTSDAADE